MKIIYWIGLIIAIVVTVVIVNSRATKQPLPSEFIVDRDAFVISLTKWGESSDITNQKNNTDATQEQTDKVILLISESIDSSKKVSDKFLDYMHPALKENYRNKLLKGEEIYSQGLAESKSTDTIASESVKKQIEGSGLINEWLIWWKGVSGKLSEKAYAK